MRAAKALHEPRVVVPRPTWFSARCPQLMKERRVGVGLVVLLIADRTHRDEAASDQASQFALDSSGSRTHQRDQLGRVVTAAGLPEEESEHALLGASEKGVSERCIELSTPQFGSDERFHTQNGYHYTQTEHI